MWQVVGEAAPGTTNAHESDQTAGGEYEFLSGEPDADDGARAMQTLASATDEQAAASAAARHAALDDAAERDGDAAAGDNLGADESMQDAEPPAGEPAATPEQPAAEQHAPRQHVHQPGQAPAAQRSVGPVTADVPVGAVDAQRDEHADAAADSPGGRGALDKHEVHGDAAHVAVRLAQASLSDDEGAAPPAPALSDEQLAALREAAEQSLATWRDAAASEERPDAALAAALWARFEALTAPLASELCEQLRLILEPTLAARMQGDYRTGKRLNTRKIIPYLASEFRRDKIWLRRSKPSVRRYQARARLRRTPQSRFLSLSACAKPPSFRCEDSNCPIAVL